MAVSITLAHYWKDDAGITGAAAGTQYKPLDVIAACPDVVARGLVSAGIANYSSGNPPATPVAVRFTRILTGAAKTTASDADFPGEVPVDGWDVLVRNSADNTVRHAVRVNGAWRISGTYT